MRYQETGRLGRITKNLKKLGFEKELKFILFDSTNFSMLTKIQQTEYIETIMQRMENTIGVESANKVLFECGAQCCGKSWSKFAKNIWEESNSIEDFFKKINKAEEKYNTLFLYDSKNNLIILKRTKCICGLINKGKLFSNNKLFCNCSLGHMNVFFNAVFNVEKIELKKSIFSGDNNCEWMIQLNKLNIFKK
jgi:hypothetical protein